MNLIKSKVIIGLVISVLVGVGAVVFYKYQQSANNNQITGNYNPQINPSDFTTKITNPYFSLPVGKKMVYESETAEGSERVEIEIEGRTRKVMGVETIIYRDRGESETAEGSERVEIEIEGGTRKVMGVETIIYRDREYLDGELVEDTKDYLAQDRAGNVWYFGEDVDSYEDGKLKDHQGAWLAGVDGAKPGIWIKADHVVGDSYRQEFYKGEAEDIRDVVALNQTVTTNRATYKSCVKFYEWTPLDTKSREHKYYCSEVSTLVLIENLETGARSELSGVVSP